jgi:hypothetical protein
VPYLFDHIILFAEDFFGIGVVNYITDIIAKRLFKVGGFGIKYHNVHK